MRVSRPGHMRGRGKRVSPLPFHGATVARIGYRITVIMELTY